MAFPIESAPKTQSSYTALNTSFASSGDNTVISAQPNHTIRIMALALTAASAVDVTLKDGSTTLGVFQGVTSLVLDPFIGHPRWVGTAGNSFIINLSSGVAVKGTIWYTQGTPV